MYKSNLHYLKEKTTYLWRHIYWRFVHIHLFFQKVACVLYLGVRVSVCLCVYTYRCIKMEPVEILQKKTLFLKFVIVTFMTSQTKLYEMAAIGSDSHGWLNFNTYSYSGLENGWIWKRVSILGLTVHFGMTILLKQAFLSGPIKKYCFNMLASLLLTRERK